MQGEQDTQILCNLIRANPNKRFVLLSRGAPPGYLTAFQYAGLMTTLEADDLLFDRDDIRKFFTAMEIEATDSEISGILRESIGYPLGVAVIARCMSGGKPFGPEIVAKAFREVFSYFESAVYRRFDLPVRRFLLELSPFESFDLEMARMVSGDPHTGEQLDWLLNHTTMLRYDDVQHFHFWPQFRAFLLWEMEREYSEEKQKSLFSRGGLYYELKEDYTLTVRCEGIDTIWTGSAEFTIAKKQIAPPGADTTSFTYTSSAQTYTLASNAAYTISPNTTQTNAGSYTITVSLNDTANTEWTDGTTAAKEYTFTISAAKLTVTALDKRITAGQSAPDLTTPVLGEDYKVDGLFGQDALTAVTLAYGETPDTSRAGSYAINISAVQTNYDITTVPGTLTVAPRPSSGGSTTYPVNTPSKTENGSVSASPKNAS